MLKIFDIQHFSIHNGPGTRTTLFFKGCPLNCSWCHNPEGISPFHERIFRAERCIGCMWCHEICPQHIQGTLPLDDSCGDCRLCIERCPTNALEVFGRDCSIDELIAEIEKDRIFYEESGGGVTLSGGEALMQGDEVIELMTQIKAHDLSLALDTSGFVSWSLLKRTVPLVDIYLYDLKHMDEETHREGTGAGVSRILENYKGLHDQGVRLWVRIPMIPTYNMDTATAEAFIRFLEDHPPEQISLLPYHQNASRKYQLLHQKPVSYLKTQQYDQQLADLLEQFNNAGLHCIIGG